MPPRTVNAGQKLSLIGEGLDALMCRSFLNQIRVLNFLGAT